MVSIQQHQEMGYDRSAGMFSPDGLLLQVEYAEKAVNLGTSVLALTTKNGILYIADRKIVSKLLIKQSFKKVFEISSHILVSGSGVMSDGRRLIEQAQEVAHEHKFKYQNRIDILALVKNIANIQQYYSQVGGMRPFGVSLLIGGVENKKVHLYQTSPSGFYLKFLARATGKDSKDLNSTIEKSYKETMNIKDATLFGIKAFKEVLKENFDVERLDIVSLDLDENFKRYSQDEIKKFNI